MGKRSETTIEDEELVEKYRRVVELEQLIEQLTTEHSDLVTMLGKKQGAKWGRIPGVGYFERDRSNSKTEWDGARLRSQCIRIAREERIADENGEVIEDPVERAVYVLNKMASFNFRAGDAEDRTKPGLRSFGLDPNDYRTVTPGILRVRLVQAEGQVV